MYLTYADLKQLLHFICYRKVLEGIINNMDINKTVKKITNYNRTKRKWRINWHKLRMYNRTKAIILLLPYATDKGYGEII